MKKILVPTDFSDNANNALQYAINIGNFFEAEIHLLNIYEVRSTTGSFKSVREYILEDVERDIFNTIQKYKPSISGNTTLVGRGVEGSTVDVICSIATHEHFDLIVMGTQGASGLKEIFLGSKTSGVMKNSEAPLLAIPNDVQYKPIKDIVFPVDTGIVADRKLLRPMLELVDSYHSSVKVLHLETEKTEEQYDPGIDFLLAGINHSYHSIMSADTINNLVNQFVIEEEADMICMIRRERNFWDNMFHRSVTKKEIFDSPVPLLVLHSKV